MVEICMGAIIYKAVSLIEQGNCNSIGIVSLYPCWMTRSCFDSTVALFHVSRSGTKGRKQDYPNKHVQEGNTWLVFSIHTGSNNIVLTMYCSFFKGGVIKILLKYICLWKNLFYSMNNLNVNIRLNVLEFVCWSQAF